MSHVWISGPSAAERLASAEKIALPCLLPPVDAHRRLRGPYTAAGTVLRALVPAMLSDGADLVRRHDIEVLSAAPELRDTVPASRETLTSLAVPDERTRFYSRLRTLRIAHGITELLRDALTGGPRRMLIIDNAHHADPTDTELIMVLLRRMDPAVLTLVICTGPDLADSNPELAAALGGHALARTAPADQPSRGEDSALASAYVDGDCTSDDKGLLRAYAGLTATDRARLHDDRADLLAGRGEQSLLLGAVPFHREHGSDPAGAGAQALRSAMDYCINMGFYQATVDLGERGRSVIDWSAQQELWWAFTTKMTTSFAALSRAQEAEELYAEARAFSTSPAVHAQAAYATAMLYTRHHSPDRLNHRKALGWINEAIAIASILPERAEPAFQQIFAENGRALIRVHLGDLPGALDIMNTCLTRADAELGSGKHRLHRSVLLYNRAQVHAGLGQLAQAIADYTAVIADDPNYAEYYLDRGNILRRMGQDGAALADYETAIKLSPPFPEVYYNRADTMGACGDIEGWLAGLDYVLELDPANLDALVNRAGLRAALGDTAGARQDADAGLALDAGNAHLWCVLGQLQAEAGLTAEAHTAFCHALDADPALQAAWAGRAGLSHAAGDDAAAVAELDRALQLGDDAALRFNRAVALRSLGQLAEALAELDRAADLDPGDPDIARERAQCHKELYQKQPSHVTRQGNQRPL